MDAVQGSGRGRRQGRRWSFGSAILDEDSWTLSIDGRRVALEAKPLELLHELLLRAGQLATKAELLDAIWPDVLVVEASLPNAVNKLRRALGDSGGGIIETVPRLGYRLAVPVTLVVAQPDTHNTPDPVPAGLHPPVPARRWPAMVSGLALLFAGGGIAFATLTRTVAAPAPAPTQRDAEEAIRNLDVERIQTMLRAGWNPNAPWDDQGNGAMTFVLNICEWNPVHDRRRLVLMARTLLEAGVPLDQHNKWGDSPYSIAKAKRYCGPDHPVTQMLRASCYNGLNPVGDKCLATYEQKRK